jgi:uncharacterized protein
MTMNDEADRVEALDVLRGVAVIGILYGNVIGFGLPVAALLHPFTTGTSGALDLVAWAVSLLLIDGKMRGLFAILFGASILLMMERSAMSGRDGVRVHRLRMLTLLPIGVAHYLLLFEGDILMLLAVAGLLVIPLTRKEPLSLLKWAGGLLGLQLLINAIAAGAPFLLRGQMTADPSLADAWQTYATIIGLTGPPADVATIASRLAHFPTAILEVAFYALPETLAFMALGMAMLKGGFLAAQWPPEQFRQTARHGYRIGLIGTGMLGAWALWSGDALVGQAVTLAASLPLRVPLVVAHAAVIMGLVATAAMPQLRARLAAVGRLSLSNYLLSSLVMAALFSGWGLGLFGTLSRSALLGVATALGLAILIWSPLWLRMRQRGPAEALWRRAVQQLAGR